MLRVHCPGGRDYKVEDCLLETELESGILQLEAGRFLGCVHLRHQHLKHRVKMRTCCSGSVQLLAWSACIVHCGWIVAYMQHAALLQALVNATPLVV